MDRVDCPPGESLMKTGLVLSGGGARGLAHIGVLKALDKLKIKIGMISGCSSGAAIGAFYAAGFSPASIQEIISENNFFHLRDFAWSKTGLLNSVSNEKMFREHLKRRTFKTLKIPLYIVATDILNARLITFSSGDLVKAILASSAIPVLFEPVKYRNRLLIDGSAMNSFPIEPLLSKCDRILGVYVNPVMKTKKISGMLDAFDRGYHLTLYHEVRQKKALCDIFLEPSALSKYSSFDFDRIDELVNIGYNYTMDHQKELLSLK